MPRTKPLVWVAVKYSLRNVTRLRTSPAGSIRGCTPISSMIFAWSSRMPHSLVSGVNNAQLLQPDRRFLPGPDWAPARTPGLLSLPHRPGGAADREMGGHHGPASGATAGERVQLGQQHGHRHAAGLLDRGGHGGQRRIA